MSMDPLASNSQILQKIISYLDPLEQSDRERIIKTIMTFFEVDARSVSRSAPIVGGHSTTERHIHPTVRYSEDLAIPPKEFLLEREPRTDVERIACLAFYLTHYRDMPYFKTLDLSKLNTEAAQPKFANAANASNNAKNTGYLVAATQGQRQLSAGAEEFVRALPDRELAKKAMAHFRPKRRSKKAGAMDKANSSN